MKKINCVLLMLFICLMNSSCKKEEPSVVSVTPSSVIFDSNASSQTISITSNTSWNVSGSASWLKVGSTSGSSNSSIILTVEENKDFSERNCTLTISTEDNEASASVSVTQKPANLTFSVSSSTLSFESVGGSQTLKINTNANWTVSGADNWLKVSALSGKGDSELTLTAEENKTFVERNCTLTISTEDGGKASSSVTINQKAAEVTLSVNVYDLNFSENKGDVQYLTITSNSDWKITGKPEWLDLSSASGTGVSTINLTTNSFNESSSARNATLVVTANGTSVEVKVNQNAGLTAACTAKLDDVVVLCDAVAFNLTYGNNVSYFYVGYLDKSDAGRMTDDEIIKVLDTNFERYTPSDDYILSFPNLESLHDYIIYTVAYDKSGKRGELIEKNIRTKSSTNQPFASVENVKYDNSYWYWNTTIGAYSSKYYQWVLTGTNSTDYWSKNDAIVAWRFAYYMDKYPDSFKAIVQSGSWQREKQGSERYIQIVTWGVDSSDNLAGVINNQKWYIKSSASTSLKSVGNSSKNMKITSKVVAVKAKDLFDGVTIHRVK